MPETIQLWEKVPGYQGGHVPVMDYYKAEEKKSNGAIVIFPGGGYALWAKQEGKGYAEYLSSRGIDCFVVYYRIVPDRFPWPLLDARRAIRYVRANAEKYGIDPEKIAVMGSSAGGHLAAFVSTYMAPIEGEGVDELDSIDCRPNGQILCYPVTDYQGHRDSFDRLLDGRAGTEASLYTPTLICDENTPKMFLWHTAEDPVVDVNGSFRYAARLHELNIPVEMHIYPYGRHGLGMLPEVPYLLNWVDHLMAWLRLYGFLN